MKELISVVIPVFNAEKYLEECIRSLQAQTYPEWEAILVDDGSTDHSLEQCRHFSQQDTRIRVLHSENAGVSAARNLGIEAARGSYLAFIDADDTVAPTYLSTLFHLLANADVSICCVDDPSDWNEKVRQETVAIERMRRTPSRYANPVFTNYAINKLYRMALLREKEIRMSPGVARCEDAYFVAAYLQCCKNAAVTTEKLYCYRQHQASAMHRFNPDVWKDEAPLMQIQYDFFHPCQLEQTEEQAFAVWEYGKITAILDYIYRYAPDFQTRRKGFQEILNIAEIMRLLAHDTQLLGKKAKILSALVHARFYTGLAWGYRWLAS